LGCALFYGGLVRQIELTKERKANPPDTTWGLILNMVILVVCYKIGRRQLNYGLRPQRGGPVGHCQRYLWVRLGWTLIDIVKKNTSRGGDDGGGYYYIATFETSTGNKRMIDMGMW